MMNVEGCQLTIADGVLDVVIHRGTDNLFTTDMCDALSACLEAPPNGAHILRVRSRGTAFCLGRERTATSLHELKRETAALVRLNRALTESTLVTLAQVQGDAAGFGVGVAALCDLSVAAPSVKVWFPEVSMGLAPSVVLAWLPGLIGKKRAFQLTATGMKIDAERARDLGLFTEVAATDETLSQLSDQLVAALRQFSPLVHSEIKRFIRHASAMSEGPAYELAALRLVTAGLSRDGGTNV